MTSSPAKRVLLTGGTGFIGRHAADCLLRRGFEVHQIVRRRQANADPRVHQHVANLLDSSAQQTVVRESAATHLLHLAWYTEHGKFWTSVENLRWVQASLELFMNFASAGGRRIVGAGTCAEYEWSHGRCAEFDTPTIPSTLYGAAKNGLHGMLEAFAKSQNLSYAWGRIFFLYGPDEHPARFVPSLLQPLLEGRPAECRCGDHVRDFIHVTDAADAFAALVDSDVEGPVNIASGEALKLGDLARCLADFVRRPDLLSIQSQAASASQPLVLTADTRRLRDEVGWWPQWNYRQGLRSLVDMQFHQTRTPARLSA